MLLAIAAISNKVDPHSQRGIAGPPPCGIVAESGATPTGAECKPYEDNGIRQVASFCEKNHKQASRDVDDS